MASNYSEKNIRDLFAKFSRLKVGIAGDIMLDKYIYGNSDRLSPEAPVPVIEVTGTESKAGGAANVALNIKSMHAIPYLFSIIGGDTAGEELLEIINEQGIDTGNILFDGGRVSTTKTRVIAKGKHVLRYDSEHTNDIDESMQEDFCHNMANSITAEKIDILILEDYNKGIFTESLIQSILNFADKNNIRVAVDPKKKNFFAYRNCYLFKPNIREIKDSLDINFDPSSLDELNNVAEILQKQLPHIFTMITLGEHGIYSRTNNRSMIKPAHVRNIVDVSGAGDTVIAVASLCIAAGADPALTTEIANIAGGIVCEHTGVVPVDFEKLLEETIKLLC